MLSAEQISSVAAGLNEKINIPLLSEGIEQQMLEQVVSRINDHLDEAADGLPDSIKDTWVRVKDGISPEEAAELRVQLVAALNERVNIPFLGEDQEAEIFIGPAVDLIISVLREKTNI